MEQVGGMRRTGSAAIDLAWVAAGRFDGYVEHNLGPWDMAAGILLVREAGGFVTDADGGPAHVRDRQHRGRQPDRAQGPASALAGRLPRHDAPQSVALEALETAGQLPVS